MAAAIGAMYSDDEITEILASIERIPCFEKDKISNYKVSSSNVFVNLKASSSFEAATKFGFVLRQVGLASSSMPDCLPLEIVCECCESEEIVVFTVVFDVNSKPCVSLLKIDKPAKDTSTCNVESDSLENTNIPLTRQAVFHHDVSDTTSREHPIKTTLNCFFHHQSFKPLQKEIILSTMDKKNVLGVLGTGGGKSLTFLLPAVLADKPTIVVVPTLSLINDLLSRCLALDIAACKITGEVPCDVQNSYLEELTKFKVIFLTPEMLANKNILDKITKVGLERIVFDEAHTICSRGSTFRPQYQSAANVLAKFPCPKLLLSATIPEQLISELSEVFGLLDVIKGTVLRDNIFLDV